MMAAVAQRPNLMASLPPVRGRLSEHASLAKVTWFGVGGAAEVLFKPADAEDLAAFLQAKPADIPLTVIGVGSNLLVRDGGVPGVVVRLGREFAKIDVVNADVICGAGALDGNVAGRPKMRGWWGRNFPSGGRGTTGGAIGWTPGASGSERKTMGGGRVGAGGEGRGGAAASGGPRPRVSRNGR